MSKLLQNSSYSVLNNIFILLSSVLSGMIIARILGPDGKGKIYLINQIVTISAVFLALGTGPSILFYLKKKTLKKSQSLSFILLYNILIGIIICFIYYLWKQDIASILDNALTNRQLLFCLILVILNLFTNSLGYVLMNEGTGVKLWSIFSIAGNISYLSFLFLFVFILEKGVNGVLFALLLCGLLKFTLFISKVSKYILKFEIIPLLLLSSIFKYSLSVFIGSLFLTCIYRIDVFFINNYLTLSELGIYSVSVTISELLLVLPNAIGIALFPHLSALKYNEQTEIMSKVVRLSLIIAFIVTLGIIVFSYPFILICFGHRFLKAYIPILFLLPGLISMTLNYIYSNYIFAIGKPYIAAIIYCFGLMVNLILNISLLKYVGINGAAIFSSVTYIVITIGFIFVVKKETKLSTREIILPTKQDLVYFYNLTKGYIHKILG